MALAKKLARALTDEVEGGFQITLEMDDGQIVRVFATEEQLADFADDFDELVDTDDAEEGDDQQDGREEEPA